MIIWANDRRRARIPAPYAGLADDEASPLEMDEASPLEMSDKATGPDHSSLN